MTNTHKTIVIAGALDTKGAEFAFLKGLIEQAGARTTLIDFGIYAPQIGSEISHEVIASAGGGDLVHLATGQHKDEAMQVMAQGLAAVVRKLYDDGQLDGIISMGGSGGTSIACTAMRALPVGVPKVMVSTLAGGDVSAFAGSKDIMFIPSIVDVAGINSISRTIFANAAGAIVGAVQMARPTAQGEQPLICASMFGNTTQCVDRARGVLESTGYEVLVFHATGSGGKTMESLISDGYFRASCDITTTELADAICGGALSAGMDRCMAAARAGIPTLLVPGCVDMCNFWGIETVPEKYRERNLYQWNPNITLMRTNVDENRQIGEWLARAANAAVGPVRILLPLKGVSMLDSAGERFWDPQADQACFDAIKHNLRPEISIQELDYNINDPEFAEACARAVLGMLGT